MNSKMSFIFVWEINTQKIENMTPYNYKGFLTEKWENGHLDQKMILGVIFGGDY